jgi:hypothetical protein
MTFEAELGVISWIESVRPREDDPRNHTKTHQPKCGPAIKQGWKFCRQNGSPDIECAPPDAHRMTHWMISQTLSPAIATAILRDRRLALAVFGFSALNVALFVLHLPTWQCPMLHTFGVPCPGCGLTRAIALLFRGEWRASLTMHAFAPMFVIGLAMIGLGALLPSGRRQVFIGRIQTIEQKTGITTLVVVALVLYWLVRLLFFPATFFQLIRG